jgi:hypothetical protein
MVVCVDVHTHGSACIPMQAARQRAQREVQSRKYKFIEAPASGSRATPSTTSTARYQQRKGTGSFDLPRGFIVNTSSQNQLAPTLDNMLFSTITAAFFYATSAYAAALPPPPPGNPHTYTPAKNLDNLAKLFPQSNLTSPVDMALKYVVLGIGTQNYTCASPDANVVPGTTGAFGKVVPSRRNNSTNFCLHQLLYTTSVQNSTTTEMRSGRLEPYLLLLSPCPNGLLN